MHFDDSVVGCRLILLFLFFCNFSVVVLMKLSTRSVGEKGGLAKRKSFFCFAAWRFWVTNLTKCSTKSLDKQRFMSPGYQKWGVTGFYEASWWHQSLEKAQISITNLRTKAFSKPSILTFVDRLTNKNAFSSNSCRRPDFFIVAFRNWNQ